MARAIDPRAAEGLTASYEPRIGEDLFRAVGKDGRFESVRGATERSDAISDTNTGTLADLVYGGRPPDDALRSGRVR